MHKIYLLCVCLSVGTIAGVICGAIKSRIRKKEYTEIMESRLTFFNIFHTADLSIGTDLDRILFYSRSCAAPND